MATAKRKRGRKANARPANGFGDGRAKSHREEHRKVQEALKLLNRREQAWDLLREGLTFKQIGERLKVSNYTAHTDCRWVYEHVKLKGLALSAEEWRALQLDRTEAIVRQHMPKRAQPRHADVLMRAMEQQRKLVPGLEAESDGCGRCRDIMRICTLMFMEIVADPEGRRRWVEGLRRKAPELAATDVTPNGQGEVTGTREAEQKEKKQT